MLVKAKETLPNCELVKSGGFADETTAELSHGHAVTSNSPKENPSIACINRM